MDFSSLVASQLNAGTIWPEAIVTVTLMMILIGDLISGRSAGRWLPYLAIAGLLASVVALYFAWDNPNPISFLGAFNGDNLSIVFRAIVALSTAATVLMSVRYVEQAGTSLAEFLAILLTATLGGMFLSGANELVMVFISLEMLSISSYLMTGYMKRDPRSNEAALKYLLIGASSSAIFLYGVSLLYGLSGGETTLGAIAAKLAGTAGEESLGLAISLVFVIAGICFKISAVPFHQWTPDVYEGSPTPVVAFLSVGSKAAGFALAIRLLETAYSIVSEQWRFIFIALAILSMILGNVVALAQTSMKRMLAYSSIGQAGFVMIGLTAGTDAGYSSMIFYLLIYLFMNLGAFACVILFALRTGTDQIAEYSGLYQKDPLLIYLFMNLGAFACVILFALRTGTDQIAEYSGLYQKDPLLTLTLSICLLSLGGIPPLAGFFGKIYLFWAGWQAGLYGLVLVGLITSVASIYYYIRVVKMMVVKEPQEMSVAVKNYPVINWKLPGMRPLQVGIVLSLVATSLAGILSNPLFTLATDSVTSTPILQSAALPTRVSRLP